MPSDPGRYRQLGSTMRAAKHKKVNTLMNYLRDNATQAVFEQFKEDE